jgi:hypothetical protein
MALLQTIRTVHHDVVTNKADLRVIVLSGLDVYVPESKVVAWKVLGTINPDDSVPGSRSCKVLEDNIGPPESKPLPS